MENVKSDTQYIETEKQMREHMKKFKYFVVFPDQSVLLYKSLREIAQEIFIPHCTLSKKIREKEQTNNFELGCVCESMTTGYVYYIVKMRN